MHPLIPLHAVIGAIGAMLLVWCLRAEFPRAALLIGALCAYSWGALIVEGVSRVPRLLRLLHYRRWRGRYHEFAGRPIRIEEGADGAPWVVAEDALAAMQLKRAGLRLGGLSPLEYRQPAGLPDMLSLGGIRKLGRVARNHAASRFERWFERQVHDPAMRRAGREPAASEAHDAGRRAPD